MGKLTITKEELLKLYEEELDNILEQCDWISYVDSKLVCTTITYVLSRLNKDIDLNKLHEVYIEKVKSLNLSHDEWRLRYGVKEIINMIYDLIEEKF